ncbi:hypothetical protein JRF84_14070 [Methylobacterium organophilum]|uniref:hypothetical protein n=1 Tax=Methylobacterium organophilum TaxID=410 RepID=UPI0019CF7B60|nr:hypothetical protein [Methylobacterium organophilum]MBN6820705.1 hypothetical protein [Methylobacterium organophilum]
MYIDWTGAGRAALDRALERAPAHIAPAILAVRDHGCAYVIAAQSPRAFTIPTGKPVIVQIGDDMLTSLGPPGFSLRSLRRFLPTCRVAAIMSGAPVPLAYERAVRAAVERRVNVAIVETQIQHEEEWADYIEAVAPHMEMHLASPTVAAWGAHG